MVWIGHVDVPMLLSENLSQNRQVVQRNYNNQEPSTYQFYKNLEQGDIPFALHVNTHSNNESLQEQREAMFSLVRQKAPLNPFEFLSEQGHLAISSVNVQRVPNDELLQGTMNVRYLPDSQYQPSTYHNPTVQSNDYSVTASGIWPVPDSVSIVEQRDRSDGTKAIQSTTNSITTEDGTLDLYAVGNYDYLYEYPDGSYTDQVRIGHCKLYNHNGSATESNWTRIYNHYTTEGDLVVESGIIRFIFNDPSDNSTHMYFYDGSAWNDVGTIDIGTSVRVFENTPDIIRLEVDSIVMTVVRGTMFGVFETTDATTSLTLDTSAGDNPIDSKYDDTDSGDTDAYMTGDNSGISFTYYGVKPDTDGDKTADATTADTMAFENLTQSHTLQFGVAPSSFAASDVEAWALTEENTERNLLQRRLL